MGLMPQLGQEQQYQQQQTIYCVTDNGDDIWPSRFIELPRPGDFVRAVNTDRTLKVIQVTHLVGKTPPFSPMVELQLGSDRTSVTPESGV